jgi:hypothetical protein
LGVVAVGAGEIVVGVVDAQQTAVGIDEVRGVVVVNAVRPRRAGREDEKKKRRMQSGPDAVCAPRGRFVTPACDDMV